MSEVNKHQYHSPRTHTVHLNPSLSFKARKVKATGIVCECGWKTDLYEDPSLAFVDYRQHLHNVSGREPQPDRKEDQ